MATVDKPSAIPCVIMADRQRAADVASEGIGDPERMWRSLIPASTIARSAATAVTWAWECWVGIFMRWARCCSAARTRSMWRVSHDEVARRPEAVNRSEIGRARVVSAVAWCGCAPGSVDLIGWRVDFGLNRKECDPAMRASERPGRDSQPRVPTKWALSRRTLASPARGAGRAPEASGSGLRSHPRIGSIGQ